MAGRLILHSILYGNDPSNPAARSIRGRRVFCSNRGHSKGCGRTAPIFLGSIIPRHTISAPLLWGVMAALIKPGDPSVARCAKPPNWPLSMEALYAFLRRMRQRMDRLRTGLLAIGPPPARSALSDPLLHAIEHLAALFCAEPCPPTAFSLLTQRCWFI